MAIVMRRLATTLFAVVAVLLPAVAALGHLEAELHAPFGGREIVVTGHAELDPVLHIEAPSGTVFVQCPECVLDKRQSGAHPEARPALAPRPLGRRTLAEQAPSWTFKLSASGSPRAPPLV
ncbi:MAG: hypothetical protein GY769_21945 [bacterium]|nr:hypothetical protein [bacterium]